MKKIQRNSRLVRVVYSYCITRYCLTHFSYIVYVADNFFITEYYYCCYCYCYFYYYYCYTSIGSILEWLK